MVRKEKITVTFFLPSLEPGGTERNVVNLVNNIDRGSYIASLVLGRTEGDFLAQVNKDIPIISLHASHSLGLFFTLITYFKKHQPDIFISAFPRINIICIVARFFSGTKTKIVITEHSVFSLLPVIAKTFWRRVFAFIFMPLLGKLIYPFADAIICVSQGIADDLLKMFNHPDKVTVIYNPVVNEKMHLLADEPVDHPWFLHANTPIILAAGRLVECKDYPTLLKAFALVLEKQSAYLVILGRGPEEQKLKKLSEELGVADKAAFLGFQENPFKYMKRSSVFVLSSLQEGFGNAIIEAMACGVPVVSTDCPTGPKEIIENNKNGILVKMGGTTLLAKALLNVINNSVLQEQLSIEGKKRAQDFSIASSMKNYEKVFEKLMSRS